MTYPKLAQAVRGVLKLKAKTGQTTKQEATLLVMRKIDKTGGPTKYGIGAAAMRMALVQIIQAEVTRQLKLTLSDHAAEFVLPKSEPTETLRKLGNVPEWIAITEGKNATWRFALKASIENWLANATMKHKKGAQTIAKGNESLDIAMYLEERGYKSLGDVIGGPA